MNAAGGILLQPQSNAVSGTTGWTRVCLHIQVPEEPGYVMVYCELRGTGKAWFDDIELTGVPGPGLSSRGKPVLYPPADFEELEGYELARRGQRQVLQSAQEGGGPCKATAIFWEDTARYDVALTYLDEPDGAGTFRLLINGNEVGSVVADGVHGETDAVEKVRELNVEGVDLQRHGRITVVGEPDAGERARVVGVKFVRTGRFQGELLPAEALALPPDLRIHPSPRERRRASGMLSRFVGRFVSEANAELSRELEELKTPDDLRRYQEDIRGRLAEFFGRWPEKTPLNARMMGKIERDECTIEKVVIESEPDYYVPLNFYVPKGKPLPAPGVCITMGHAAEGKGYHLYHEFALGLVRKGYVVCAFDPMGQGERISYFEPAEEIGSRGGPVGQHHYMMRHCYLVGRTLSGLRTWDGVRAVDYMLSRPEIDPERIAVGGNSGGGQMTLLITACHPRVTCCAAAHPGGSMENTYLLGKRHLDLRVIGLIPPRPCRWIVGDESGEERGHRSRYDYLQRFYDFYSCPEANDFILVDGVHDMKRPKREAAYEWYNRWLAMPDAGTTEDELDPLTAEDLWVTETGQVLSSLGGETGQTINARLMREMAPARPDPAADEAERKRFIERRRERVLQRLGLVLDPEREPPASQQAGDFPHPKLSIEKLVIASEPGIELPALLIAPREGARGPVFVHAAELGKPQKLGEAALPFRLALAGHRVLSVDVRGTGELDLERGKRTQVSRYDQIHFRRDSLAISSTSAGRTMLGQRAFDLIRCVDYLRAREDTADAPVVLVGERVGGSWCLAAAVADERPAAVATVGTLASYRLIIENKWNNLREYFWVPGALADYDLCDLPALIAPRPVALINVVDQMVHVMDADAIRAEYAWAARYYEAARTPGDLRIVSPATDAEVIGALCDLL